jgi:threonine dehydratase
LSNLPITYEDIAAAHRRIAGVAHRTPTLTSTTANAWTGARLFSNVKLPADGSL